MRPGPELQPAALDRGDISGPSFPISLALVSALGSQRQFGHVAGPHGGHKAPCPTQGEAFGIVTAVRLSMSGAKIGFWGQDASTRQL